VNPRALPAAAVAVLVVCTATVWRPATPARAIGTIAAAKWPYLPGSRLQVTVDGFSGPYVVRLLGNGQLSDDGTYDVPAGAAGHGATLIAGNAVGIAAATIAVASPPPPGRAYVVVASYDDGIVVHDAASFAVNGVLGIEGRAGDAASDATRLVAVDTQGDRLTTVTRGPWHVARTAGVPLGDEVALDARENAFVTNRELQGRGGVTRITPSGSVASVVTGTTAEGIAIDSKRKLAYVANVNDGTVAVVSTESMRVLRRFHAVDRVFSLALADGGTRLFAVSNQSADPPFAVPGRVVAFDLRSWPPREAARSANLAFPLGAAYDAARNRLFVTDESADIVYVLDPVTLRSQRMPLATCHTPWKPHLDTVDRRLYIPCARSSQVDAFDATTLRRIRGAPFATGGYPLSVTVWRSASRENT
jgi:hypothetical protein